MKSKQAHCCRREGNLRHAHTCRAGLCRLFCVARRLRLSTLRPPPFQPVTSCACLDVIAMALFSKRLTCFYCGRRSNQPVKPVQNAIRKFHCEHCEADNYLDQVRLLWTQGKLWITTTNTSHFSRMETSQTLRLQKQTPRPTAPTRKTPGLNRWGLKNRTCFVPNVFATNICLPTPWQHTSRPPMIHLSIMNTTIPNIAGARKTDIRQYATIASLE